MLVIHLAVCLHTAFSKSVTHDEIWHLPVGLRNLREGNFSIELVNPPLSRMWAAVPLVLGKASIDPQTSGQAVGEKFVKDHPRDYQIWYRWGRVFHLVWTLGTAAVVFWWSRLLFGSAGGLLSLLLYVSSPTITAMASVVTPDSAGMFGFVASLFLFWRWCESPGWNRSWQWGTVLGLALGLKFTNLLLIPLLPVLGIITLRRRSMTGRISLAQLTGQFFCGLAVALVVIWASYGFQGLFQRLDSYRFQSADFLSLQTLFSFFSALPVPLPSDCVAGLDEQRFVMSQPHPVFLDGQWSIHGFRTYFLFALLYKLPHLFQVLFLIAVLLFVTGTNRNQWRGALILLLPGLALLGIASRESLQLGIRYILPIIPLLMIFTGNAAALFARWSMTPQRIVATVILLGSMASLRYHPNHLACFNELAGGPLGGRYHLIDSNLDWGQDLDALKQYLDEQGIDSIGLAYFGTVPPTLAGIDYTLPPSWQPQPGRYAVSVNFVMGRPHGITLPDGTSRSVDFDEFGYFRFFTPVETLGGSIDIYQLTEEDVAEWNRARAAAPLR